MVNVALLPPVVQELFRQRKLQWANDVPPPPDHAWAEEAADRLTRLDPVESTVQTDAGHWAKYVYGEPQSDIAWRHSGWASDRTRVYEAMCCVVPTARRIERFAACGYDAWIMADRARDGHYAVRADHCHDRFCVPCMRARGMTVAANLRSRMGREPHRLITLTVRGGPRPLADALRHLYTSFVRLRRSHVWRTHVAGGVGVCEVVWNAERRSWHPHLHLIVAGSYIPKNVLSDAWLLATGDSFIIDLRLIRGVEECVKYVTKYVSKPMSRTYLHSPERLREAMVALTGRRLCTTFGTWRGVPLYDVTSDADWIPIGKLSDIRAQALAGDERAMAIMAAVAPTSTALSNGETLLPPDSG